MIFVPLAVLFFLGTFFLTALSSALRRIEKRDLKKQKLLSKKFFYKIFSRFIPSGREIEGWIFTVICTQHFTKFAYVSFSTLAIVQLWEGKQTHLIGPYDFGSFFYSFGVAFFLFLTFLIGDYLPRIFGLRKPEKAIEYSAAPVTPFLLFFFPISLFFLKFSKKFYRTVYFDYLNEPQEQAKEEILEIIQEAKFTPSVDVHDKKLIESVLSFRERIVREVMVPRVDVFSLSSTTTIKEAARLLDQEGYSRTPVYRNTVDDVIGVLMYKDLIKKFLEFEQKGNDHSILQMPIESIQKNVIYAPETKKISQLLQEFRKKQTHLAIVVDEYGGTEGIVTIEDILEEIVGEIADEYDDEAALFIPQSDGSWIVDARMSISDVDEKLGIQIPQQGEYDTIGGYIFHHTGAIPLKGFLIHHDHFVMEVLRSNDRCVEKVKIKPSLKH